MKDELLASASHFGGSDSGSSSVCKACHGSDHEHKWDYPNTDDDRTHDA